MPVSAGDFFRAQVHPFTCFTKIQWTTGAQLSAAR